MHNYAPYTLFSEEQLYTYSTYIHSTHRLFSEQKLHKHMHNMDCLQTENNLHITWTVGKKGLSFILMRCFRCLLRAYDYSLNNTDRNAICGNYLSVYTEIHSWKKCVLMYVMDYQGTKLFSQ